LKRNLSKVSGTYDSGLETKKKTSEDYIQEANKLRAELAKIKAARDGSTSLSTTTGSSGNAPPTPPPPPPIAFRGKP